MWSGESREFASGTYAIEAAEVIGVGLHGLKDPMGLHIVQERTNWITVLMIFKGFSMVAAHLGAFLPCCGSFMDLLVIPGAKVFVQESSILAPLLP